MPLPDLAEVLDHYGVQFKGDKTGEQSIRCPVHDDKHASASLNLEKQVWTCHACGGGGTSVAIIMAREGVNHKAALKFGERFAQSGDDDVRASNGRSVRVPEGSGYRPRYFRNVPSRPRKRPDYGT